MTYRLQTDAGRVVLGLADDVVVVAIPVCVDELGGDRCWPQHLLVLETEESIARSGLLSHLLVGPPLGSLVICVLLCRVSQGEAVGLIDLPFLWFPILEL